VDSQVVGFISLNGAAVHCFTFLQAERLQAFASQAAIAVKIARLSGHAEKPAAMMERQRSAKDLHDLLSQTLWTASLMADALPELGAKDPAEAGRSLEKLLRLMHDAFAEMRTLLLERRPAMLVEVPLDDLLNQLTGAAIGRGIGAVAPSMEGRATSPPDLHTAAYRLPQEAFVEHNGVSTFPSSSKLTQREAEVLELMVAGLSNAEIAQRLSISTYTVKNHVSGILVKMGVSNRTEAVSTVLRRQS
jgi:ATP/maltotriose-dependent transcriptional regulator MalT